MDITALAAALDAMALQVKAAIPEADYIIVGRERIERNLCGTVPTTNEPDSMWVIEFYMPRRDKRFRVMKNQLTRILGVHGETFDVALGLAVQHACYHRTGKFEVDS